MKTIPALAVMALMLGTAVGDVVAGRGYHDGWAPRHAAGYGKVIRVKPVYKVVEVSVPEEDCSDARIANTAGEPERAALAGAFVGGIVGAVAGNQFGPSVTRPGLAWPSWHLTYSGPIGIARRWIA